MTTMSIAPRRATNDVDSTPMPEVLDGPTLARIVAASPHMGQNGVYPSIECLLRPLDWDDSVPGRFGLYKYISFSPAAERYTEETLESLGFDFAEVQNTGQFDASDLLGRVVETHVFHQQFGGVMRPKAGRTVGTQETLDIEMLEQEQGFDAAAAVAASQSSADAPRRGRSVTPEALDTAVEAAVK